MGMKSASSWFAKKWTVRTSPMGDPHTYQVTFDMDEILANERETVQVLAEPAAEEVHFTEITLVDLHKPIAGRTKTKIRTHLTDIYRMLIREGQLNLVLDGLPIVPVERKVLEAPYFKDPGSGATTWKKEIEFCFGAGYSVSGFAALLETGDSSGAGFALYRRGRAVQGTGDERYRPKEIFGGGNSFRHQRLFGELELSGFSVSHTKDGFQWSDVEEEFQTRLKEILDEEPLPLLRQAEGYRKLESTRRSTAIVNEAVTKTSQAVEQSLPPVLDDLLRGNPCDPTPDVSPPAIADRRIEFMHDGRSWSIGVSVASSPGAQEWFTSHIGSDTSTGVELRIELNNAHPFVIRFAQKDSDALESVLRVAVSMVVGTYLASESGVRRAASVIRHSNQVITRALSNP